MEIGKALLFRLRDLFGLYFSGGGGHPILIRICPESLDQWIYIQMFSLRRSILFRTSVIDGLRMLYQRPNAFPLVECGFVFGSTKGGIPYRPHKASKSFKPSEFI
jgi:hypothetical protein